MLWKEICSSEDPGEIGTRSRPILIVDRRSVDEPGSPPPVRPRRHDDVITGSQQRHVETGVESLRVDDVDRVADDASKRLFHPVDLVGGDDELDRPRLVGGVADEVPHDAIKIARVRYGVAEFCEVRLHVVAAAKMDLDVPVQSPVPSSRSGVVEEFGYVASKVGTDAQLFPQRDVDADRITPTLRETADEHRLVREVSSLAGVPPRRLVAETARIVNGGARTKRRIDFVDASDVCYLKVPVDPAVRVRARHDYRSPRQPRDVHHCREVEQLVAKTEFIEVSTAHAYVLPVVGERRQSRRISGRGIAVVPEEHFHDDDVEQDVKREAVIRRDEVQREKADDC